MAMIANTFNPELVVVGGELAGAGAEVLGAAGLILAQSLHALARRVER